MTTFEEYVDQAITGFGLQGDSQVHRRNLIEIYQQQMHKLSAVETLIILQVSIFFHAFVSITFGLKLRNLDSGAASTCGRSAAVDRSDGLFAGERRSCDFRASL